MLFLIPIAFVAIAFLYFLYLFSSFYILYSPLLKKILLKEKNAKYFYLMGDISYALGIGVAGNGLYELFTKNIMELYALFIGIFAIIGGTILRERNKL